MQSDAKFRCGKNDLIISNRFMLNRRHLGKIKAFVGQLLMISGALQIANHNYPHHASDLVVKSFCLMVVVLSIIWFSKTVQGESRVF